MSKKKNIKGVVYSTNPHFDYQFDNTNEEETLPPQQQLLKIEFEKNIGEAKRLVWSGDLLEPMRTLRLWGNY